MTIIKKLVLAAILATGFAGTSFAADIESNWNTVSPKAKTASTASVGKVHSVEVNAGSIGWQVDVRIQGAKNRECTVAVELCNAAGQPYLNRDGSPVRLEETIKPTTDSFHVSDLSFSLGAQRFWTLYGRNAKELTFRVVVIDESTGAALNSSTVMSLSGLGTQLPPAPPEKTDVPSPPPGRIGNVWMRLIFA